MCAWSGKPSSPIVSASFGRAEESLGAEGSTTEQAGSDQGIARGGHINKARMSIAQLTAVLVVAAGLLGCDDSPKPYDQRSYDAGFRDDWADTCDRIDKFKDSIGKALKQARIC